MTHREEKEGWISLIEDSLFEETRRVLASLGHTVDSTREPTEIEVSHNQDLILAGFEGIIQFLSLWTAANSKNGESFDRLSQFVLLQLAKELAYMRPGVYEVGKMTREEMKIKADSIQRSKH